MEKQCLSESKADYFAAKVLHDETLNLQHYPTFYTDDKQNVWES